MSIFKLKCLAAWLGIAALATVFSGQSIAQENPSVMTLAGGKLQLKAPMTWNRKKPQTMIVEHEFSVPAAQGDTEPGRVTAMGAGGDLQANIDRWYGQFTQADGGNTRDRAKVKKMNVADEEIHLVDISGTFKDSRGPAAPSVDRPKYRMLGAIIATKSQGTYFIKFTGPQRTVADNEQAFVTMIESLQHK